ncbi:glutathione binding-like protein [Sphingobium phenoxybenzoativorans]|uniref:glutathione binding-like protein n=1 Tax=Sphingobium phenoxybenzoativorans TaxID=1592790 RepID=UPI00087251AA|nr:glutathione binding-like protein [Sphingobium phenoxybenzoativorans]
MIKLYGMSSPNVVKVIIMLEEISADWSMNRVRLLDGEQFTDEFLALNLNSKVPVIVDDEVPGDPLAVMESGAILIHLAETRKAFLPIDPTARSLVIQWLMLQMSTIGPMFGQYIHFLRFAPAGSDYGLARYRAEMRRLCKVVDQRLNQAEYLGGKEYSIADMATYPWIKLIYGDLVEREIAPAVEGWLKRIGERPAVMRAEAFSAEIKKQDVKATEAATPAQFDRIFNRQSAA